MVYDELTAEENLAWTARLYGMARPGAAVRDALEKVGLLAVAAEPVGRFSRGMKQRLSLARSLLNEPDLVLWDEPYAGLDRRGWERLEENLRDLRTRGATVVVVAHRWEPLWPFADRVVYMRAGRIRYEGAREALDPEGWRRLLEEDGSLERADGIPNGYRPVGAAAGCGGPGRRGFGERPAGNGEP